MKNHHMVIGEDVSVVSFSSQERGECISYDHCHDRYEITYLLSARGRYIVEGHEHKVSNGSLLLICPMSYHKVELEPCEVEGITVEFSKSILSDRVSGLLDGLCDGSDIHGRFYSAAHVCEALISVFDRFALAQDLKEGRDSYLQALLTEVIVLLSATEGELMVVSEDELGARVARYLNTNFRKNVSLDRLARRFFVSKYHLCRAFKEYSGISVHAYVNHKRIIFAKSLIESGMTASGAAEKVGFGDYSAFYRAYVKILGKSPNAS